MIFDLFSGDDEIAMMAFLDEEAERMRQQREEREPDENDDGGFLYALFGADDNE